MIQQQQQQQQANQWVLTSVQFNLVYELYTVCNTTILGGGEWVGRNNQD